MNDKISDEDILRIEENACPTCGSCSGMFTANSMNCLTEAIGLSLPGNGSVLATHTARKGLYEDAARTVVDVARRYYDQDDESVLPRNIATHAAFENAMALDIAMGEPPTRSCTCWPPPRRRASPCGLDEINEVSRRVPCLAKVAPNVAKDRTYYMEDVHRAGGIPALLGELHRAGLLNEDVHSVPQPVPLRLAEDLGRARRIPVPRGDRTVARGPRLRPLLRGLLPVRALGGPGRGRRGRLHPLRRARLLQGRRPGGLKGNLAVDGCVVKTAGVDESIWTFEGPAVVLSPRKRPSTRSSRSRSRTATSWSSATRVPRAAPVCRRCSTRPRSSRAAASAEPCALITDGRFSGGTSACPSATRPRGGLRRHHRPGPGRRPHPHRHPEPLGRTPGLRRGTGHRRDALNGVYAPRTATARSTAALRAYAAMATSADKGAVRDVSKLG